MPKRAILTFSRLTNSWCGHCQSSTAQSCGLGRNLISTQAILILLDPTRALFLQRLLMPSRAVRHTPDGIKLRRRRHSGTGLGLPKGRAPNRACLGEIRAEGRNDMVLRPLLGWLHRSMPANRVLAALVALALAQSAEAGCQDPSRPRVDWIGCSKRLLMLGGGDLTEGVFSRAVLTSTDFRRAKLPRAKLNEAEISFTRFEDADLSGT